MLAKRIIPCLDINNCRVVKGAKFVNIKDIGIPAELAARYDSEYADEIVMLDIMASSSGECFRDDLVGTVGAQMTVPFLVGGGIKSIADIHVLLRAGADKIALNTSAIQNPRLLQEASCIFGRQCIVLAIDAKQIAADRWEVFINGGRTPTGLDVQHWAKKAVDLGAGEILLTSMDADGVRKGYDIPLTHMVANSVSVPIIASGGAGCLEDFYAVFSKGKADAALAASVFHSGLLTVMQVKQYLAKRGISVRL